VKTRYLFPVWPGAPYLSAYSLLEARIGSLRLLVSSSSGYGLHLLAIIIVVFGYLGSLILIASSPFYQQAAPWRYSGFTTAFLLVFLIGFFALLFWEEHSIPNWTMRLTSRNPRRHKQVRPIAIRPGLIFQELYALIDEQEVLLRIEGSHKHVLNALTLARISIPERASRRGTISIPIGRPAKTLFGSLVRGLSETSVNTGGIAILLFIGGLFSLYVWYFIQDPLNWIWRFALVLFGWLVVMIVQLIVRSRRFYCYKCDGYEVFLRKHGEWKCHKCGEATAL